MKAWKLHLAADRTSCSKATANQVRLMLHTAAYWLLWSLRSLMPRRSAWRVAQFDTLRLRLVKLVTRVVELKTRVTLRLPSACPNKAILHLVLERMPRLVCYTGVKDPAELSDPQPASPAIRTQPPDRSRHRRCAAATTSRES